MDFNLSENEKLARDARGIEGNTTYFQTNEQGTDDMVMDHEAAIYNDRVQDVIDRCEGFTKKIQEVASSYAGELGGMEIMPLDSNVLVQPYAENPFQRLSISDSGVVYDTGGQRPMIKNTDTGVMEEAEQYIKTGVVVEVGPACKYLKRGDTVMWNLPTQIPVPFYSLGFMLVNERNIICVINDDLTQRFKNGN